VALARALLAKPRPLLIQLAGLDEIAGVASSDGLVAALGVPAIGTYANATVVPGTAPLQGRGAFRFPTADHYMAGYNNGSSAVNPPGLPPFDVRGTPLKFQNPIGAVHAQLAHFFATHEIAAF
jgi:hypothetical protein